MDSKIYREEILEHYKDPQNFGKPTGFTKMNSQYNPFCGDSVTIYLTLNGDSITGCAFTGKGCAISIAAASILTEFVKRKKTTALTKMTEKDMLTLLGVEVSETRKKCALLALSTLKDCLIESQK